MTIHTVFCPKDPSSGGTQVQSVITQIFLFVLETSDRQVRSGSLSSDDVMGLSQSQQTLSRSSTLPYDHIPQRAQPQRGVSLRTKTRPSSPGSEMVTLEEFLQEGNIQSPPMVIHAYVITICCGSWHTILCFLHISSIEAVSCLQKHYNCITDTIKSHDICISFCTRWFSSCF